MIDVTFSQSQKALNGTEVKEGNLKTTSEWEKQLTYGKPLDYSFKDIKQPSDLLHATPVSGTPSVLKKQYSEKSGDEEDTAEYQPYAIFGTTNQNSLALKAGNNLMSSINGLFQVCQSLFDTAAMVSWIDLSCNQLTTIEDELLQFPNLQVLYLHGNHIDKLNQIDKLKHLTELKKLTLHGNPIVELSHYRMYVGSQIPTLIALDFSTITWDDRDFMDTWARGHQFRKQRRDR